MNTKKLFVLSIFCLALSTAFGQHKYSCSINETAFEGNDLVSYFSGKVLKGLDKYSTEYDGLKLKFHNYDNLLEFKKDPEKYLPKYGGWCATAVANNIFIKPDYNMYKIQEGRLLFFEVKAFYNGRTHWEKNPEINEIVADKKYRERVKK